MQTRIELAPNMPILYVIHDIVFVEVFTCIANIQLSIFKEARRKLWLRALHTALRARDIVHLEIKLEHSAVSLVSQVGNFAKA